MTMNEIETILKISGNRMTKSRKKMIEIFTDNPNQHFTIDELIDLLAKKGERNVATVYNNLAAFVDLRVVYEFTFNHKKHYELVGNAHGHFVCKSCGKVENVEIPGLSCISMSVEKQTGARVLSNNIEFFGCCSECKEEMTCNNCGKNCDCEER